ncbi:hypothetical protein H696_00682 [Fonticula alba]|uniref:Uncharacterized protein n=1 Tax=Fonticula alba TaxID=691883 RepID=A0A058ZFK2_FONAL|nr:hypothetical protein H696_00682 [Fonticula alba]KCV73134.1 hypothetical protein H696_00682 [Fonticula alba]|eukprot:XP_009492835.1 hypothetical protein H696_00682 [Fonticula alba]
MTPPSAEKHGGAAPASTSAIPPAPPLSPAMQASAARLAQKESASAGASQQQQQHQSQPKRWTEVVNDQSGDRRQQAGTGPSSPRSAPLSPKSGPRASASAESTGAGAKKSDAAPASPRAGGKKADPGQPVVTTVRSPDGRKLEVRSPPGSPRARAAGPASGSGARKQQDLKIQVNVDAPAFHPKGLQQQQQQQQQQQATIPSKSANQGGPGSPRQQQQQQQQHRQGAGAPRSPGGRGRQQASPRQPGSPRQRAASNAPRSPGGRIAHQSQQHGRQHHHHHHQQQQHQHQHQQHHAGGDINISLRDHMLGHHASHRTRQGEETMTILAPGSPRALTFDGATSAVQTQFRPFGEEAGQILTHQEAWQADRSHWSNLGTSPGPSHLGDEQPLIRDRTEEIRRLEARLAQEQASLAALREGRHHAHGHHSHSHSHSHSHHSASTSASGHHHFDQQTHMADGAADYAPLNEEQLATLQGAYSILGTPDAWREALHESAHHGKLSPRTAHRLGDMADLLHQRHIGAHAASKGSSRVSSSSAAAASAATTATATTTGMPIHTHSAHAGAGHNMLSAMGQLHRRVAREAAAAGRARSEGFARRQRDMLAPGKQYHRAGAAAMGPGQRFSLKMRPAGGTIPSDFWGREFLQYALNPAFRLEHAFSDWSDMASAPGVLSAADAAARHGPASHRAQHHERHHHHQQQQQQQHYKQAAAADWSDDYHQQFHTQHRRMADSVAGAGAGAGAGRRMSADMRSRLHVSIPEGHNEMSEFDKVSYSSRTTFVPASTSPRLRAAYEASERASHGGGGARHARSHILPEDQMALDELVVLESGMPYTSVTTNLSPAGAAYLASSGSRYGSTSAAAAAAAAAGAGTEEEGGFHPIRDLRRGMDAVRRAMSPPGSPLLNRAFDFIAHPLKTAAAGTQMARDLAQREAGRLRNQLGLGDGKAIPTAGVHHQPLARSLDAIVHPERSFMATAGTMACVVGPAVMFMLASIARATPDWAF